MVTQVSLLADDAHKNKEVLFDNLTRAAASVQTIDNFKQWTREAIRPIFPHETLGCGYGRIHAGGVGTDGIIAVDYPIEHLKDICNKAGGLDTPILRRWLMTREPQLFDGDVPWPDIPQHWFEQFQRHGMKNVAAHAVYDTERCIGTYHSFHRIPGVLGETHISMLRQLAPIMHEVLCRVIENLNNANAFEVLLSSLSIREREVLRWVAQGKTNREISQAIFLSEMTVKHHLMSIFNKLRMESRAQLIHRLAEHDACAQPEYGVRIL
ncbi:response regulator transcription factor [Collimonas pratensis]|uniref:Bacterial regulatory s, luxR family protein n=1 Tax=Collimonas pratensis TaxID=279113 RepID=A0ABM5Z8I7_9BURK|nr:helix-turn-helix transcriptional regulator [Collimonas pratensis]AMP15469.1 bacterial regulatory s, luxR family protein [Collimonas pratensis]